MKMVMHYVECAEKNTSYVIWKTNVNFAENGFAKTVPNPFLRGTDMERYAKTVILV